jgi:hypothetical protein
MKTGEGDKNSGYLNYSDSEYIRESIEKQTQNFLEQSKK